MLAVRSMIDPTSVGRFKALFTGFERAFGRYILSGAIGPGGKLLGRAETKLGPVGIEEYRDHLEGATGLGIIPLTQDNHLWFGAIDVDTKDHDGKPRTVDVVGLAKAVDRGKLPFVVCRSKSGGAHLYVFFKQPADAGIVRRRLAAWAGMLGYGDSEIFPKQDVRATVQDLGNWINLPYFGDTRKAVTASGEEMPLEAFLRLAEEERSVDPYQTDTPVDAVPDESDLFHDGPPCLARIHAMGGFPEGTRNDGMMAVAVYLRKRFKDKWTIMLPEYAAAMCREPLEDKELSVIQRSAAKKEYSYRCKLAPINAYCSKPQCLQRPYGIGQSEQRTAIEHMTFYRTEGSDDQDSVFVGFEVAGRRCFLPSSTVYSRSRLNEWSFAHLKVLIVDVSAAKWPAYLSALASKADEVLLPADSSDSAYISAMVLEFLSRTVQTSEPDALLRRRTYRNDTDEILFRLSDLRSFLAAERVEYGGQPRLIEILKKMGTQHRRVTVLGVTVNVWAVQAPGNLNGKADDDADSPDSRMSGSWQDHRDGGNGREDDA